MGTGDLIRKEREAKRWSQGELARRTGLNPASISRYESGLRVPKAAAIVAIARALGKRVEYFFETPTEVAS